MSWIWSESESEPRKKFKIIVKELGKSPNVLEGKATYDEIDKIINLLVKKYKLERVS